MTRSVLPRVFFVHHFFDIENKYNLPGVKLLSSIELNEPINDNEPFQHEFMGNINLRGKLESTEMISVTLKNIKH